MATALQLLRGSPMPQPPCPRCRPRQGQAERDGGPAQSTPAQAAASLAQACRRGAKQLAHTDEKMPIAQRREC